MRSSTVGSHGSTISLNRRELGQEENATSSRPGSTDSLTNNGATHQARKLQGSSNILNRGEINYNASESQSSLANHSDLEGVLNEKLSGFSKTNVRDRARSGTATTLKGVGDIMSMEKKKSSTRRVTNQRSSSGMSKATNVDSNDELPVTTESLISALGVINNDKPNIQHDTRYTKIFLQKQGLYNLSIWSHLTDVLNKIISEQPPNVIDYFEEYSRKVKEERLIVHDSLRDIYVSSPHFESAKNLLSLINVYGVKEDVEDTLVGEDEGAAVSSNQMDLEEVAFYLQQAGIAIPEIQLFTLNISMKKLVEENNLQKSRFWGKVYGTQQDYFVFECELTEEECGRRIDEEKKAEAREAERIETEKKSDEEEGNKGADEINMAEVEAEKAKEEDKGSKTAEENLSQQSSVSAEKHTEESVNQVDKVKGEEKTAPDNTRNSVRVSHEVTFDPDREHETVQEEEQEDPLLPPLPPPKKLLKYKVPPLLQPVAEEVTKVPAENIGTGLNKKVYYVSNSPEIEWVELPKVTPQEINIARQIKVYMTGDLESKIKSYPEFPGTEKSYLRAQIARISAATLVSPLGYYKFGKEGGDNEEEEEEEEVGEEGEETSGDKTNFVENPNYQPIPVKGLIDPSLASWVHHSQHVLKQGRADWWNPKKTEAGDEEAEEEEVEEEEEEEGDGGKGAVAREKGPALLSSLSEDSLIEGNPAWSVTKTHDYNRNLAGAVIRSNLWPGAHAFAFGKKIENVYCGWGHKHLPHGFSPAQLPHPEYEYELGPEIMEIQDPTVEVEQAWRLAHKKKPPPAEGEEEEGEEIEEEEEEDEDDD